MAHHPSYYFIASPYNGSEEEKKYRYELSRKIAAAFLEKGISVFAPILYNQAIIQTFQGIELEERRKLLMPMNLDFLHRSQGVIFVKVPGWDSSWGIKQYLDICAQHKIPTFELNPDFIDSELETLANELAHKNQTSSLRKK